MKIYIHTQRPFSAFLSRITFLHSVHVPCTPYTTLRERRKLHSVGFGVGLFPVHSPLLRESLLFSFPPLTYMLKFSG